MDFVSCPRCQEMKPPSVTTCTACGASMDEAPIEVTPLALAQEPEEEPTGPAVHPFGAGLSSGCTPDSLQQGIGSAAEADVVGEDDGPEHVVVPVDGVDTVDARDPEPGLEGDPPVVVVHLRPAGRRLVRR
jgi:hypothetical protein